MGIVGVSITDEIEQHYSLPPKGALIMRIASYGPADKASLIVEDVIVAIDGRRVDNVEDVQKILRQKKVQGQISLTVFRGNRRRSAEVVLEEAE